MPVMAPLIGKYELRGTLGAGAFGTVYLGYQADLDRKVAIKELAPRYASDPAFLEMFRQEARIMGYLDDPHCVRVFDFLEIGGHAYLVSEFVEGASLRKVIESSGKLSPEQSLGVLKGCLMGLGHAHQLGLTHRDIKPENILADQEGTSKLADFGQAGQTGTGSSTGSSGSPAYMSPEQVHGQPLDPRSDLYSMGCVLFEFFTGRVPFIADNPMAMMRAQVSELPPDPRHQNPALPEAAVFMLGRALAKDPAQRYQSAGEFQAALEQAAQAGYGRDWERSASIKGMVAGAAALAAGAGVAGAVGAGAAGSAAAGTAAGGTTAATATVGTSGAGLTLTSAPVIAGGVGAVAVAGAAAVLLLTAAPALAGKNIIVNGDAEAGAGAPDSSQVVPPPGWNGSATFTAVKYGVSGFPTTKDWHPAKGADGKLDDSQPGQNFFAGGNSAQATATQAIDVSSAGGWIDKGGRHYEFKGYIGGYSSQGDQAVVEVHFLDSGGKSLGDSHIGPVTSLTRADQTGLFFSRTSGTVPVGTRKVQVKIVMTRTDGSYNDGYVDDLSLVLS
jgi:hypothetical protein